MSSFDTIYLGYPIWHGTMPVFSFLEEYDFAGKTIIPFSTHDGSGLGASRRDIQKLCPKAVAPEGLVVRHDRVRDAQNDVNAWIRKRQKEKLPLTNRLFMVGDIPGQAPERGPVVMSVPGKRGTAPPPNAGEGI